MIDSKRIETDIEFAVALAKSNSNPTFIGRLDSGWAFLGLNQVLTGCCFLVADPIVAGIEELSALEKTVFFDDMLVLGRAIQTVTGAVRVNYLFLGNKDPVLHVHIVPRFADEPEEYRSRGPWHYPNYVKFELARDQALVEALAQEILKPRGKAV